MKVLLLAAGRGTRISRYLAGNPKCTVDIGGQKLIQYTIELFHKKGITDIAMVLGYRAEVIQETLKDYEGIRYFYNPFFDVTNSIASAWFAKDFLSQYDDTLIMNADVYLEETLLDRILECHKSPVMFADGTRKEEADYKYGTFGSIHDEPDISFYTTDFDVGFISSKYLASSVVIVDNKGFDTHSGGFAVVSNALV